MLPLWLIRLFARGVSVSWPVGSGYKNPDYMPEAKRMRLLKLVADQVIRDFEPKVDIDGNIIATFCNVAVDTLVKEVWGSKMFSGMMANNIIQRMSGAPDFAEVDAAAGQKLADDGRLVIAGFQAEPHGHVAVLFPGAMIYSGKWRCEAPMIINVGKRNGIMSANYAFVDKPKFWTWIENAKEAA